MALTDTEIRKAKQEDASRKLADEKGLYLLVTASGSKLWRMNYRYAGKYKTLALGVYPEVSLKQARDRRDEARKVLAEGIDPSAARQEVKRVRRIAAENTFEAIARAWFETRHRQVVSDHAKRIQASLENDVFPEIGKLPITEVKPSDVLSLLRKVEARGALDTVKRLRQRISDVFIFAIAAGLATINPAAGLHKAVAHQKATHRPALLASDLRDFFMKLEVVRISQPIKAALRLLVLTFVRPGELRGACWSEFDLEVGTWIIPAERDRSRGLVGMKMKEAHTVPLAPQAVTVLKELQAHSGHGELVFPNRNDHQRPISNGTLNSALRAMGYAADQVTGHGFRSTATGALLELGWRPEVIDRQLAHRERNQVFGAYAHTAQYLKERRAMMESWANYVDSLCKGAEVIPIRAGST